MIHSSKEAGQGLVEYALIMILVSVAVMVVIVALGPQIGDLYSNIMSELEAAGF